MLKTKSLYIVTALVAAVALGAATEVWAAYPYDMCLADASEPTPNFTCNGHTVEGPLEGVPVACSEDPENGCRIYTWKITSTIKAASHLSVSIPRDVTDNIVDGTLGWAKHCDGDGDPSIENNTDFSFGSFQQWHCTVVLDPPGDSTVSTQEVFLKIKGKSNLVFTDGIVKAASSVENFGWGITTGPGSECEIQLSKYNVSPRVTVDDIGDDAFPVRVRVLRDAVGCGFQIDYCINPDPILSYKCNDAWIPAETVSSDPNADGVPIISCSEIRIAGGVDICDECTITQQINPGWIYYKIAGTWYKICAGVTWGTGCWDSDTTTWCDRFGNCTVCNPYTVCPTQ